MSIDVLEPPPDRLLTTVATVKRTMGIPANDESNDDLIMDMILGVSDFIMTYTARDFARQLVKESVIGLGNPNLLVSITPIIRVEEVALDGNASDGWSVFDKNAGIIQRDGSFSSTEYRYPTIDRAPSPWGRKKWHVTYEGGYILPGWGESQGARTFPYDLERAVVEMVKSDMMNSKFDGTMKSYKIGDTSISWGRGGGSTGSGGNAAMAVAIPPAALAVLNFYRRAY